MPRILTQAHVNDFRNRLCDVAARLYFEVGHDGFNMRDLAARLGVSAMTPYRYFRDKNEILSAVRARSFARLAARLEAAATGAAPEPACAAMLEAYAGFALEEPANYRLMFDLSQTPELLPELTEAEARAREAFANPVRALSGSDIAMWAALHGALALHLAGKLTLEEINGLLTRVSRLALGIDHDFDLSPAPPAEARQVCATFSPMMSAAE